MMKNPTHPALAHYNFQRMGITLIAACFCLISSCSKPDLELSEVSPEESVIENYSNNITIKQAEKRALEVIEQFMPASTKSVSRRVKSGEVVLDHSVTRSGGESSAADSLFYVVNFENDQGYVVLAADNRTVDVLVVSDEGNMDWRNPANSTQQYLNNVLVDYQRASLGSLIDGGGGSGGGGLLPPVTKPGIFDIGGGGIVGITTRPTYTYTYGPWSKVEANRVKPMIKTKWDQADPYNRDMPVIWFSGGARSLWVVLLLLLRK